MRNLEEGIVWLILWVGWAIHDYYFGRWRILGWVLSPVVIAIIILVTLVFV